MQGAPGDMGDPGPDGDVGPIVSQLLVFKSCFSTLRIVFSKSVACDAPNLTYF